MNAKTLGLRAAAAALLILISTMAAEATYVHGFKTAREQEKVRIVVTVPEVAQIVEQVGGDMVAVTPLLKAGQDVHSPHIYKSMLRVTRDAQIMFSLGADYDPWVQKIVKESGNATIADKPDCNVDISHFISIPASDTDKDKVHYWADTQNDKAVAAGVLSVLQKKLPEKADYFNTRYSSLFEKKGTGAN